MDDYAASIGRANKALEEAAPLIDESAHLLDGADAAASQAGNDIASYAGRVNTARQAMRNFTDTVAERPNDPWIQATAQAEMIGALADLDAANLTAAESYARLRDEAAEAAVAVQGAADSVAGASAEEEAAGGGGGALSGFLSLFGEEGLSKGVSGGALTMPALIGGIMGLIGGLEPALMAAGAGAVSFGALAVPALYKVASGWEAVSQAQTAYETAVGVYKRDPTKDNLTAEKNALATLQTTWARLPKPIQDVITEVRAFGAEWKRVSASSGIEGDAIRDVGLALKTASDFLPSVVTMARAAAPVISGLWTDLDKNVKSSQFKSFVASMAADVKPAAQGFHEIASAVGGWFSAMSERGGKTSAEFLDSLAGMLKKITPASVTGFLDAAKIMSKAFDLIGDLGSKTTGLGRAASDVTGFFRDVVGAGERANHDVLGWDRNILQAVGIVHPAVRVKPQLDFSQPSFNAQSLRAALDKAGHDASAGASAAKVSVSPQVDKTGLQKSLNQAASDVKIHGATVDLANAKLSGLSALAATMSTAGKTAGADMDKALAAAISSGGAAAVGDTRKIAAQCRAALASLPGEFRAVGTAAGAGLAAGISASTGAAVAAAAHMASAVEAAARVTLQTQSPSKVFAKIGAQTVQGFVAGLLGGTGQVRAAMALILGHAVNDLQIAQAVAKMRTEIQAALRAGVITAAQESEYAGWLRADNRRLQHLASERATLERQIKAADALAKSVQAAAISEGSVTSAYAETWAGKAGAAQSPTYRTVNDALKAELKRDEEFRKDIARLKKEGLDRNSIQALLAEGVTAGLPQAEELLASGKGGVRETAKLEKEIAAAAKKLGITGANASYESGAEIGKGLAAGLRSQLGAVEKEMKRIADELVKAIRAALRIASPSQVTREIGQMAAAGIVAGADDYATAIRAAGARMGAGLAVEPIMTRPGAGGPGHGGYSAQPIVLELTVISEVDGRPVRRSTQKYTLQHARRNTASGLKLAGRGA